MEYCSALTLGTSLENVQLLEACQSRAIRIICRAPFSHTNSFSVSTARIFLELPLLSERRSEHFLKIVQNVIDGKGSSALLSSLSECKSRTRGLRNSCQWILPNPVTNHGRRRFVFQAIRVLKSLSLVWILWCIINVLLNCAGALPLRADPALLAFVLLA